MYPARAFFRFGFTRVIAALLTPWLGQKYPCADLPERSFRVLSEVPSRVRPPVSVRRLAIRRIDRRVAPACEPKARPFRAGEAFARYSFQVERAGVNARRSWALRFSRPGPL